MKFKNQTKSGFPPPTPPPEGKSIVQRRKLKFYLVFLSDFTF